MKINMTCVSKEYEIKTKNGARAMTTTKNAFLLGYNLKIVAQWWGGIGE